MSAYGPGPRQGSPSMGGYQPGPKQGDPSMGGYQPGPKQGDPTMGDYQPSPQQGDPSIGRYDNEPAKETLKPKASENSMGDARATTSENRYMIPLAVGETFLMLGLLTMNYVFRFNAFTRDSSSLADYNRTTISVTGQIAFMPYYNYTISHADNQKNWRGFGISFGMPEYAFFITVFLVPLFTIIAVELWRHFYPHMRPVKTVVTMGLQLPTVVRRIIRFYFVFLLYGCGAGFFASFIKLLVPVPRPHFVTVCLGINGSLLSDPAGARDIIGDGLFELCPTADISTLKEALRSFPSYHATIAVYAGVFLCLYLHHMLRFRGVYSVTIMLSLPVHVMLTIGSLHRLATYHSYISDIAWGAVLGLAMALCAVYGMLNNFEERFWPADVNEYPPSHGTRSLINAHEPTTRQHDTDTRPNTPISRVSTVGGRRLPPTQAYNSTFEMEEDHGKRSPMPPTSSNAQPSTGYNVPRQRPGAVLMPNRFGGGNDRPPQQRPPRQPYEGRSYF